MKPHLRFWGKSCLSMNRGMKTHNILNPIIRKKVLIYATSHQSGSGAKAKAIHGA